MSDFCRSRKCKTASGTIAGVVEVEFSTETLTRDLKTTREEMFISALCLGVVLYLGSVFLLNRFVLVPHHKTFACHRDDCRRRLEPACRTFLG